MCWLWISPMWSSLESHFLCLPYFEPVFLQEERFVPDSMGLSAYIPTGADAA